VALVRERTIPSEWPPLVGQVSDNFCRYRLLRGQHDGSLRLYSRFWHYIFSKELLNCTHEAHKTADLFFCNIWRSSYYLHYTVSNYGMSNGMEWNRKEAAVLVPIWAWKDREEKTKIIGEYSRCVDPDSKKAPSEREWRALLHYMPLGNTSKSSVYMAICSADVGTSSPLSRRPAISHASHLHILFAN
jgi:hypothetical protein